MSLRIALSLRQEPDVEPKQVVEPVPPLIAAWPVASASASAAAGAGRDRIDAALQEMRDYLSDQHPATDAEALQSLRHAFPSAPLADRIAAIQTRFFA